MMENQYRVLIVDDEDAILQPYQEFFTEYGFDVEIAQNGREGLEKLRDGEFDVAIVDIKMPVMNGMEMIRCARAEDIDTDMILLTGHGGEKEAVEALNLGAAHWIYKHAVDMSKLKDKVIELTEGSLEEVRRLLSSIPEKEWQQ
ncbi:MAG: response regulator [Gammaproteobacteria bacterium]|nr:response regulator [Gammaproteobacteria bacterium]